MRLSWKVLLCVAVLLGSTPRPADAWWRWLEEMSGPGWYTGANYEFKLWCRYPEVDTLRPKQVERIVDQLTVIAKAQRDPRPVVTVRILRLLSQWQEALKDNDANWNDVKQKIANALLLPAPPQDFPGLVVSLPCVSRNDAGVVFAPRRHTFSVSGGYLVSTINRLQFAPSQPAEATQVHVVTVGALYDGRLPDRFSNAFLDRFEGGVSFELFRFDGVAVPTPIWRLATEVRSTFRLKTFRDVDTGTPIFHLKVRGGTLWFNKGFTPAEFGALPGDALSGRQVHTSVRVIADFECLPWRSDRC